MSLMGTALSNPLSFRSGVPRSRPKMSRLCLKQSSIDAWRIQVGLIRTADIRHGDEEPATYTPPSVKLMGRAIMNNLRASWKRPVISGVAASLLSLSLPTQSALSDSPARGQAREVGSKSAGPPSKRSKPPSAPTRKSASKPEGAGNFIYGIINTIRAESEELCMRYGNPSDCLQEAEVCLTMRDEEENQVRLCLNTVHGESSGQGMEQKSRFR